MESKSQQESSFLFRTCDEFAKSELNIAPTLSVLGIMTTFTLIASYFLWHHVVDSVRSDTVYVVGLYIVFSLYFIFDHYLTKYSSSYRRLSERKDKQFYVLSNIIKSGVLAAITPFGFMLLKDCMINDTWRTHQIRNLGCIYAVPDTVSLFMVTRMTKATKIHHICVVIFNIANMYNDYSNNNICRLLVVYSIFSTFAYLVNLLLASRFMNVPSSLEWFLSFGALIIYSSCCGINWTWQVVYIRRLIEVNNHWSIYLYSFLICFVVYDDCVLNWWLLKNVLRMRNNDDQGGNVKRKEKIKEKESKKAS